jgi:hypothetical protein
MRRSARMKNDKPEFEIRSKSTCRFLLSVAGVDEHRLRQCPSSDRLIAIRIGIQLCASAAFFFATATTGLLLVFGKTFWSSGVCTVMAAIIVVIVTLFDGQIIAADFYEQGYALAVARGLIKGASRWHPAARYGKMLIRFVLSYVLAVSLTNLFLLRYYDDDIRGELAARYRSANAALFQRVKNEYDSDLSRLTKKLQTADAHVASLRSEEDKLEKQQAEPSADQTQLTVLLKRAVELQKRKDDADLEVNRRKSDRNHEIAGVKESQQQSGNPGQGRLWQFAIDQAALAQTQSQQASDELADIRVQIGDLRATLQNDESQRLRTTQKSVAAIQGLLAPVEKEVADLGTKRTRALANRETEIQAIAERRPEYVPLDTGFIARAEALYALEARPSVRDNTFWTTAVIVLIDMSTVLSKLLFTSPTEYALRAALDFEAAVSAALANRRRRTGADELDDVEIEKEVEKAKADLFARRAARRRREEVMRNFYPDDNRNNTNGDNHA